MTSSTEHRPNKLSQTKNISSNNCAQEDIVMYHSYYHSCKVLVSNLAIISVDIPFYGIRGVDYVIRYLICIFLRPKYLWNKMRNWPRQEAILLYLKSTLSKQNWYRRFLQVTASWRIFFFKFKHSPGFTKTVRTLLRMSYLATAFVSCCGFDCDKLVWQRKVVKVC